MADFLASDDDEEEEEDDFLSDEEEVEQVERLKKAKQDDHVRFSSS